LSKRFQVQLLNGQLRNTIPNGAAGIGGGCPYICNALIGDSNVAGLGALWNDALVDQLPAYARAEINPGDNYSVTGAFMGNNWTLASSEQGLSLAQRNSALTSFQDVQRDLGNDTDAGTAGTRGDTPTIDPLWSLAACNQQFYRNNLSAAGDSNLDGTYAGAIGTGGVFYIKHGISGGQIGRTVRQRRYVDGSYVDPGNPNATPARDERFATAPEFFDADTAASYHPDNSTSTPNLYDNLQGNMITLRDAATGSGTGGQQNRAFFDCIYINFFSASGKHLGGSQMYSDFLAFYQRLSTNISLPAGAVPNMVICKPQIGAFERDRVESHREAFGRITAKFPHVAFVSLNDLSMNGKNHFTAESYVEMGRRMAVARQGLPASTLYEISI